MNENKITLFKKGFNFSQDGPGHRLVYHLAGCNMRCPWCSNPEGMHIKYLNNKQIVMTIDEMYEEIIQCKRLFFDGGGVTFTGGEATLQLDQLKELFALLKAADINATIETNGSSERLRELFPYMNFIIIDFKHYDEKLHKKHTGLSNKIVKANIEKAIASGLRALVRIPLINGFNASEEDIEGFLTYFKLINKNNLNVEFLKYHEYGKDKWLKTSRDYRVENGFISNQIYREFILRFKKAGIKVIKT
ncbi:MAG TPA: radical SAM protein [Bacilli bacterium]|nr:radical SAM protein [Bacilli bacterium]